MTIRAFIFWLHLIAGILAGVVILIMCATGTILAFEKEIIAWAERDVRLLGDKFPDAPIQPLDDLLAKVRESVPGQPSTLTVYRNPHHAVQLSFGRTNVVYSNPYTGEVMPQGTAGLRRFMQTMIEWHRYLAQQGDSRPTGKAITGACNAVFLVLALTGLYLWWPRQWSTVAWRSVILFNFALRGKARDWNWHNVIGFWTAPVLIVLTATAMPISYRWAGDMIYKVTGTQPPPGGPASAGAGASAVPVSAPAPGTKPLAYEALLEKVREEFPEYEHLTVRFSGAPGGPSRPNGPEPGERKRDAPAAVTIVVKEPGGWPRTATTTLTLDPFTGNVLKRERFADFNLGRQIRTWTRFLHTGEALGKGGQFVAGIASLGGVILVWTGFAMAWRRFFKRRRPLVGQITAETSPPIHNTDSTLSKRI